MAAIRPPARLVRGLLAVTAVLGIAPGVAHAAACPFEGPLQSYQRESVAFVGQAVERRDATVVLSVSDGTVTAPATVPPSLCFTTFGSSRSLTVSIPSRRT